MELDHVLTRLAEAARNIVWAESAAIYLLDEEETHLTLTATSSLHDLHDYWPQTPIRLEQSPIDMEACSGQRVIIGDVCIDPRATNIPRDFHSGLCIPLVHEDRPVGTLHVYAYDPWHFSEEDTNRVAPLADVGAALVAATRAVLALKALDASKGQFIRVATHELRSPVAVAQSLVRGVLKGYAGEMTEKQADVFGRISRRLDGLEGLINDLLDLAAGKAPGMAEEEGPISLNGSVGRAVVLLQPRAEEKGLSVRLEPCRDSLIVWGTEEGLDRIFVNLVSNAVKYTPTGGVAVTVRCLPGQAQVKVADTGIGIPEEALAHLFEEFYRAPNAKALNEVGTGLGLAIVKDLVERYKGRIEVNSTVGQGSTFTVTFPLFQSGG